MKTKFRGLALTAILLTGTSMTFADQGVSSAVGDIPGYGEDAYFDEEAAYAEPNYVAPAGHATVSDLPSAPSESPQFAPVGAAELQPAAFQQVGLQTLSGSSCGGGACGSSCGGGACGGSCSIGGCDSYTCGGGCDGGCNSGCDSGCGLHNFSFGGLFDSCGSDTWAQAELLLWFTPDRKMAPLVTTSPAGTLPYLDNPQTNVAFGDPVQGELSAGIRLDYGKWFTENVGFGGRFWGLANNNDSFAAAGDGTGTSIGRPFLDLAFGGENAVLVNYDGSGAGNPSFAGGVIADSSLSIWGAEAYSRVRFSCAKNCRLDFIGGYSHFSIHDELGIASTSINIANPATGRTRSFADSFDVGKRVQRWPSWLRNGDHTRPLDGSLADQGSLGQYEPEHSYRRYQF